MKRTKYDIGDVVYNNNIDQIGIVNNLFVFGIMGTIQVGYNISYLFSEDDSKITLISKGDFK